MNALSLDILGPAFVAGLLILATHVPLGMIVLNRGIIFIDIALAQVAALGVVFGTMMWGVAGWGVQLSAIGAAILRRNPSGSVVAPPPPERVYAPCAALAPTYDHAYDGFCRVHPALRDTFAHLACPPPPTPPTPAADSDAPSTAPLDPRLNQRSTMDWLEAASHA